MTNCKAGNKKSTFETYLSLFEYFCADCSKLDKKNRNNPEKNRFLQQIHYGFFCKKVYDNTRFGRLSVNRHGIEYSGWKGSDIFGSLYFKN